MNHAINLYMSFSIFFLFGVEVTETYKQHISLTEPKKLNCLLKLIIHVDAELFLLSFSLLHGSVGSLRVEWPINQTL